MTTIGELLARLGVEGAARGEPRHVRGHTSCDCGLATGAALARVPYAAVSNRVHRDVGRTRGVSPNVVARVLQHLTKFRWEAKDAACAYQLREWAPTRRPAAFAIVDPSDATHPGHWLAMSGTAVFDGALEAPLDVVDYYGRRWPVRWLVRRRRNV
jgi:hypothetical protein